MLAGQPPFTGHQLIQDPRSGRRPLRPKNLSTTITDHVKLAECVEISRRDDSNKENVPPFYSIPDKESFQTELIGASLVDELNAFREKLERLRIDKDKNDKLLSERCLMLDLEIKEILNRGEVQKELEIEVDRLYRLKEIKLACMMISRIRSLRDKEEESKMKEDHVKKALIKSEDGDERKDETPLQSQNSEGHPQN